MELPDLLFSSQVSDTGNLLGRTIFSRLGCVVNASARSFTEVPQLFSMDLRRVEMGRFKVSFYMTLRCLHCNAEYVTC